MTRTDCHPPISAWAPIGAIEAVRGVCWVAPVMDMVLLFPNVKETSALP